MSSLIVSPLHIRHAAYFPPCSCENDCDAQSFIYVIVPTCGYLELLFIFVKYLGLLFTC